LFPPAAYPDRGGVKCPKRPNRVIWKNRFKFKRGEEAMEGSFKNGEKRSYPRFVIDLPLEYREMGDSSLRGGIVIDVSEGGLLMETVRDIPVGTELIVTVLFPKGPELASFKAVAKIVRKKPCWKEDSKRNRYWEGYQYGLEFIQILEENRWKLNLLLGWTT
jgi:hypothetical protein